MCVFTGPAARRRRPRHLEVGSSGAAASTASPEEEAGEAADDVPSWLFLMAAIKT